MTAAMRIANFIVGIVAALILTGLISYSQYRDEKDAAEAVQQAARAKEWSCLDAEGRRMVAYDRIGK